MEENFYDYEDEKQAKCDKYDENRKLTVVDCYGRNHKFNCKCSDIKRIFFAKKNKDINIYFQKMDGKLEKKIY